MKRLLDSLQNLSIISTIRLILGILFTIAVSSSFLLFFDNMIDVLKEISWLPGLTEFQGLLNYIYCIAGFILLVVAVITGRQMERRIGAALKEFSRLIDAMRKGNYQAAIHLSVEDELGYVIHSLNRLANDLEKANTLRRKTLAGIAHELNTPLTTLRGNLEAMTEGVFLPDEQRLKLLLQETIYLQRLISDLRELSLAEAGELPLNKTPVSVAASISHVLQMLEPLLKEKEIRIITCFEDKLPTVFADKDRLYQIIYNLIVNAQKFSRQQGQISISAKQTYKAGGSYLVIVISDNGIGISQEDIPLIFEQFYRADKSRSRKTGGSGIGLAIVKQLVQAHGGYAEVSSSLGQGSIFSVYLPLLPASAANPIAIEVCNDKQTRTAQN